MTQLLFILLDQQTQEEGGGAWSGMIMILAMIVIFYFFMIRPQSKKQKALKKEREALKKGDKIVTAGGIHGRIKSVKEHQFMMEIAPGVVIEIDKASVFAEPVAQGQGAAKDSKQADNAKDSKEDAGAVLEEAGGKAAE